MVTDTSCGQTYAPTNYLGAEDDRQTPAAFRIGQVLLHVPPLHHAEKEEPERGDLRDDRDHRQLPLFEQVDLVAAEIVGADPVESTPRVAVEGTQVPIGRCASGFVLVALDRPKATPAVRSQSAFPGCKDSSSLCHPSRWSADLSGRSWDSRVPTADG